MEDFSKFGLTSDEPLGKNPFPEEDERHQGWVAISLVARKNLTIFNSGLLARKPPIDAQPRVIEAWWVELLAGRFVMMGSAGVGMFALRLEDIAAFEKFLDHFAEFILEQAENVRSKLVFRADFIMAVRL